MVLLLLAALAGAAEELPEGWDPLAPTAPVEVLGLPTQVRVVRDRDKVRMVPLRFDTRLSFRDDVQVGSVFEVGAQVSRTRRITYDLNVAYAPLHRLTLPGPERGVHGVELTGDGMVHASRFLSLGPTLGVAWRQYRQQFTRVADAFVPLLGGRVSAALLTTRKFSLALTTRWSVDLSRTRMVMETSEVRWLHPVEGQFGVRMNFGHGKLPEAQ